jgi:hypothetical protein
MKILILFSILYLSFLARAFEEPITPAVGFGLNSLNLTVNTDTKYSATNTNYYFLSLGYKGFSLQTKYPNLDPEETRKSKVDSKIQDHQLSFDVYKKLKATLFFQDYKGYFIENSIMRYWSKAPDLNFNHVGGQVFYVFNDQHASFLVQDTYWDQSKDSSSWVASAGFDQFKVNGDLIPTELKVNKNQILKNLKVDSYTLRFGYSRNWVWTHWFAGSAIGMGYSMNQVNAKYEVDFIPPESTTKKSYINSLFAVSSGYKWVTAKIGMFARVFSWNIEFDNIQISSNTSTSGFYYSQTF